MVDLPLFDSARNWATQGVINYFEIFSRRVAASSNKTLKPAEAPARVAPILLLGLALSFAVEKCLI
jgi:hypothetical protein